MILKGRIVEVMESYPPQLIVEAEGTRYFVELLEDTSVIRAGIPVDFGILYSDQDITIEGDSSEASKTAMTARKIGLD